MSWLDLLKAVVNAATTPPANKDSNAGALPDPLPTADTTTRVTIDNGTQSVYTFHIADLAKKYETSNKGPGYISNGSSWGDPGGDSYGSYQIETKQGTMDAYLKYNDRFSSQLEGLVVNSAAFKAKWVEMATNFADDFQQSQFDFLCSKSGGYNDAIKYAKQLGWRADSFAMQAAVFSTSNQSGGWKNIFNKAAISAADSITTQLNKLYDARARYFLGLSSLSTTIKTSIMQSRCGKKIDMSDYSGPNERRDCLKLI